MGSTAAMIRSPAVSCRQLWDPVLMLQEEMPWDCFSAPPELCPVPISPDFSFREKNHLLKFAASPSGHWCIFIARGWSACVHLTVLLSREHHLFAIVSNVI